ncbi:MAG: hypothetical protein MJ252_08050 [archaeon]|nr:hypothetical protein [archaeon]
MIQSMEAEQLNDINKLTQQKNELFEKIPKKNLSSASLKELSNKDYCDLKFSTGKIDDAFIYRTLQKDLNDYKDYIHFEMEKREPFKNNILDLIQKLLKKITPDFEAKIYGSYAHNLAVPWSNLNIGVYPKNPQSINENYISLLRDQLANALGGQQWVSKLQKVESSVFTLLRILTCEEMGEILVEINVQSDSNINERYVELVKEYLIDFPILEPMILALKTILKNANLHNPTNGGLSSYGLILLVVSFLQCKLDTENADNNNEYLLGRIFYGFLGHYGIYFDYQKYAIITHLPKKEANRDVIQLEKEINVTQTQHEFVILDPLNSQSNVAVLSHQYMNLKMAFMIAYMVSREDCECGCHYGKATYVYQTNEIEHCILKRMFNSVKRFTDNK